MLCTVTCFDRVLNLVESLPESKLKEAVEVATEYSFQDMLDFGVENNCFTESQASTLFDGIVMWENLEDNYWEEDYEKLHALYDKMGITEDVFEQYIK